jgi:hypothetical protein
VTEALRRRNDERCRRNLDGASPLRTDDLAWEGVGTVRVDEEVLRALVYMRDVEGFTDRDLVGFTAHPNTLADPLVRDFLDVWRAEEAGHTAALDRYLLAYRDARWHPVPERQHPPAAEVSLVERALSRIGGPVGAVVTAAHMTWGAANELLTLNRNRLLARRAPAGDPELRALLDRIAAQEARHYSFYLLQAEWRLAESGLARRLIPAVLRRAWTPVGVGDGYKDRGDFDRLLAFLTGDDDGRSAVRRMDRRFASLPGLADLRIYARAAGSAVAA